MNIMDFANDDNFRTTWQSNPAVKQPWFEVELNKVQGFNMITIVEDKVRIKKYRLEYNENGVWKPLPSECDNAGRVKIHRFARVWGNKVRILIDEFSETPALAEFGVFNEQR
jgi:alpha-L-fucosidase